MRSKLRENGRNPPERRITMIEKLKNLTVAKYQGEALTELRAQARLLYSEYESQKLDIPDWLNSAVNDLDREIASRVRDERSRRLSEARARRASLKTTEEKRSDLDKEILELEDSLK